MKSINNVLNHTIALFIFNLGYFLELNCQSIQTENPQSGKRSIPAGQFKSNQNRVNNEYIITLAEAGNVEDIKQALDKYEITEISDLGNNSYLIKIKKDPGHEIIAKTVLGKKGIKSIQPNFIYKAF